MRSISIHPKTFKSTSECDRWIREKWTMSIQWVHGK